MPREQTLEWAVVGTAVFEAALLELRRLAHPLRVRIGGGVSAIGSGVRKYFAVCVTRRRAQCIESVRTYVR